MYLHKHISANNVLLESFPFQRELAMEAYIFENPTVLSMEAVGLNEVSIEECEVKILDGRADRNSDGRIDILAKYGQEYLAVVELKLDKLQECHLAQLESYLKQRQKILETNPKIWDSSVSDEPKWIGVLIGSNIDPDLMIKIRKGYYVNDTDIPIAALTINRYKGKDGNVYVVTDTYFLEKLKNRDYTKYVFKGKEFGKSRLVLAVIKDFVERNPTIKFAGLKNQFPDTLQGRETFTTEVEAREKIHHEILLMLMSLLY
ncbi:MAG: hypothetical protein QM528_04775 [Phycisphaerales bacterium]|nr:hypothetical protein [Phycisphaerales bacterium]